MITQFNCPCGANSISDAKKYDGSLGYEAVVCRQCGRYSDDNGSHEADDWSKDFTGIRKEGQEVRK
jgi:transcription elongation factor Elf1